MKKITIPISSKKPISYRCFIFNNTALISLWILLFSLNASAQVVYTGLTPARFIGQNKIVNLDIDSDGITDLKIAQTTHQGGQHFYILPRWYTQVAIENDSAAALAYGDIIDENLTWSATDVVSILDHVFSVPYSSGNWSIPEMGYLAIRIKLQGQWHYSWIRLYRFREGPSEEFYFEMVYALDMGMETNVNQAILAGDGIPNGATSLYASDAYDLLDGRDIMFSFTKAVNESLFSEYRIVVAKADDPNALDLDIVNALLEERYSSNLVDTSDHFFSIEKSLFQETVDMDGDPINPLTPYQVHILNIASSGNQFDNILSAPSNTIILKSETKPIGRISVKDISNDNKASDIQIMFDAPYNSYADHYRVFIAPLESLEDFTVNIALSLPQNYHTIIEKDHPVPYEIILNERQLDIEGNPIENDQFYEAIALSVADSIYSLTSVLSDPSRKFILKTPDTFFAGKKTGANVVSFSADNVLSNTVLWDGNIVEPGYDNVKDSHIDLNRDGEDDFHLVFRDIYTLGSRQVEYVVKGERDNTVLICSHSNHSNWIDILDEGDMIDEGYEFTNATTILTWYARAEGAPDTYYGHIPLGFEGTGFYIGFQINDDDQVQYAWLKLMGRRFVEYGYQYFGNGLSNTGEQKIFSCYPNPSSEIIKIEPLEYSNKEKTISIHNSMGLKMVDYDLSGSGMELDISQYPSGIYFFVIKDQGQIFETHKVMVE